MLFFIYSRPASTIPFPSLSSLTPVKNQLLRCAAHLTGGRGYERVSSCRFSRWSGSGTLGLGLREARWVLLGWAQDSSLVRPRTLRQVLRDLFRQVPTRTRGEKTAGVFISHCHLFIATEGQGRGDSYCTLHSSNLTLFACFCTTCRSAVTPLLQLLSNWFEVCVQCYSSGGRERSGGTSVLCERRRRSMGGERRR